MFGPNTDLVWTLIAFGVAAVIVAVVYAIWHGERRSEYDEGHSDAKSVSNGMVEKVVIYNPDHTIQQVTHEERP
jgi:hypothetical protein